MYCCRGCVYCCNLCIGVYKDGVKSAQGGLGKKRRKSCKIGGKSAHTAVAWTIFKMKIGFQLSGGGVIKLLGVFTVFS